MLKNLSLDSLFPFYFLFKTKIVTDVVKISTYNLFFIFFLTIPNLPNTIHDEDEDDPHHSCCCRQLS